MKETKIENNLELTSGVLILIGSLVFYLLIFSGIKVPIGQLLGAMSLLGISMAGVLFVYKISKRKLDIVPLAIVIIFIESIISQVFFVNIIPFSSVLKIIFAVILLLQGTNYLLAEQTEVKF